VGCAFGCQVGFIAVEHFGIVGGGVVVRSLVFCGIPRVLEAVLGDSVSVWGCCFLGGGGARGGGRDRERRIIILKEEKEKGGGGSSGDRDRESVSSGLIAGKGGRWRQLG
jgi:hypothetical protein